LLGLIKHSWLESGSVYGHRKVTTDLRELGETCSRHCVARLMKSEGLRAMVGKPAGHTLFVVQGEANDRAHLLVAMSTEQAAQTPVEESVQLMW